MITLRWNIQSLSILQEKSRKLGKRRSFENATKPTFSLVNFYLIFMTSESCCFCLWQPPVHFVVYFDRFCQLKKCPKQNRFFPTTWRIRLTPNCQFCFDKVYLLHSREEVNALLFGALTMTSLNRIPNILQLLQQFKTDLPKGKDDSRREEGKTETWFFSTHKS